MISFGVVYVDPEGFLDQTFYGQLKPITDKWDEEALAVTNMTREKCFEVGNDPAEVMGAFFTWLDLIQVRNGLPTSDRLMFWSDNNGWDYQWINYYFWHFVGDNPFGHSSNNLRNVYNGMVKNTHKNHKHLRVTPHTHHPVDDSKGNAEALLYMIKEMELKM